MSQVITEESVFIDSALGYKTPAMLFTQSSRPRAAVVVACAMGVDMRYYQTFAKYLASKDIAVILFQYYGVGASAKSVGVESTTLNWGRFDLDAVIRWMGVKFLDAPLWVVGHSIGGQIVGLAESSRYLRGAILVTSQSGYWKYWPASKKYLLMAWWYVFLPLLTAIFGKLPLKLMSTGEDVSKTAARMWAGWCRDPSYMLSTATAEERVRYEMLKLKILSFSFSDDSIAPKPAVEWLLKQYKSSAITHRHEVVAAGKPIGHFGFFKKSSVTEKYWDELSQYIFQNN